MPPYTAAKTFPVTCPYPCAAPGGPYRPLGSSVAFLIVDRMEVFSSSRAGVNWLLNAKTFIYLLKACF